MWYKDGQPLEHANRKSLMFNFGYALLSNDRVKSSFNCIVLIHSIFFFFWLDIKAAEYPRDTGTGIGTNFVSFILLKA